MNLRALQVLVSSMSKDLFDYRGVRCKDCAQGDPSVLFPGEVYHCKRFNNEPMKAEDFCSRAEEKKEALFFETFNGKDYYRDKHGNIYTEVSGKVAYCSTLKRGSMTLDKSEPYYEVTNIKLIKGENQ